MLVLVGLGNPGVRYAETRHNIGFMVVDRLAIQGKGRWLEREEACSRVAAVQLAEREVLLVKPQTYMNRSGLALASLQPKLEFRPEEVLVLLDEFELDFGRLRLRRRGSDGGHNGLASVLEQLGSRDVPRLRLGIGQPPPAEDAIDYVLRPFDSGQEVDALVERACRAVEVYIRCGIEAAMNRFNGCQAL